MYLSGILGCLLTSACCRPIHPNTAHTTLKPPSGISRWANPSWEVCADEKKRGEKRRLEKVRDGRGVGEGEEGQGRRRRPLIMVMDEGEDAG